MRSEILMASMLVAGFTSFLAMATAIGDGLSAVNNGGVNELSDDYGHTRQDAAVLQLSPTEAVLKLKSVGWRFQSKTHAGNLVFWRENSYLELSHAGDERLNGEYGLTAYEALSYLQEQFLAQQVTSTASVPTTGTPLLSHRPFHVPLWFKTATHEGRQAYMLQYEPLSGLHFDMAVRVLTSSDEAVALVRGLLKVLAFLQSAGLMHRDIDRRNVLVNGTEVYLIDFSHAVWSGRPARGMMPSHAGLHRPPDWLICGFDDFYSAGVMMRDTLLNASVPIGLGIQQAIYHMTRQRCQDRIRDVIVLTGMLDQHGSAEDQPGSCYESPAQEYSVSTDEEGCGYVTGPQTFHVCPSSGKVPVVTTKDFDLAGRAGHGAQLFSGQTVLDIGGGAGYFSLHALLYWAREVQIVETRASAVEAGHQLSVMAQVPITYQPDPVPADVVHVTAQGITWLSCHHSLGTVTELVDSLASYSRRFLILEWPLHDPDQPGQMVGQLPITADTFRQLIRELQLEFGAVRCTSPDAASGTRYILAAVRADDADSVEDGETGLCV